MSDRTVGKRPFSGRIPIALHSPPTHFSSLSYSLLPHRRPLIESPPTDPPTPQGSGGLCCDSPQRGGRNEPPHPARAGAADDGATRQRVGARYTQFDAR
eukprot:scaffold301679_cov35-Tisochrysis_lutea.AAC.1